jgi:hypothetical protein
MKSSKYQKRFYRRWVDTANLCKARVVVNETDVQILTNKPVNIAYCTNRIRFYRLQIERYIAKDERFLTSLKPIAIERTAPAIVKEMAKQSKKANVGPMAAVAGAVAWFLGRDFLRKGYTEVIIENGGDIFLKVTKPVRVGIYTGDSRFNKALTLIIRPEPGPISVCTSSGTIGHSLSFGCCDAAVIISANAALADAVATATGNLVNSEKDLHKAISFAKKVKGIRAAVIVIQNKIAAWGAVEFAQKAQ